MNLLGFYPDTESDFKFTVFIFVLAVIISFFVFIKTKNKIKAAKTFSVLGNLALLPAGWAGILSDFGMRWLDFSAVYIWPIANLMLFVKRKILALFICSTALNLFFGYVFLDNPPYKLGLFSGILWPLANVLLLVYLLAKKQKSKK